MKITTAAVRISFSRAKLELNFGIQIIHASDYSVPLISKEKRANDIIISGKCGGEKITGDGQQFLFFDSDSCQSHDFKNSRSKQFLTNLLRTVERLP